LIQAQVGLGKNQLDKNILITEVQDQSLTEEPDEEENRDPNPEKNGDTEMITMESDQTLNHNENINNIKVESDKEEQENHHSIQEEKEDKLEENND
jgi:hypothetical protein